MRNRAKLWLGLWALVALCGHGHAGEGDADEIVELKQEAPEEEVLERRPFEALPEEIWVGILTYLGMPDWAMVAEVHPELFGLVQDFQFLGPIEMWELYEELPEGFLDWEPKEQLREAVERKFWGFAVRAILRGADVHGMPGETHFRNSPLHEAAAAGAENAVEVLLEHGARVDSVNARGNTPAHEAAAAGHGDVVRLLLAQRAPVEARNNARRMPIHVAAVAGYEGVVRCLLEHGVPPGVLAEHQRTALHLAARAGRAAVVEVLLAYRADVNAPDVDGSAVARAAVEGGSVDVVRQVIAAGVIWEDRLMRQCLESALLFEREEVLCELFALRPALSVVARALENVRERNEIFGSEPERFEYLFVEYMDARIREEGELVVKEHEGPREARM